MAGNSTVTDLVRDRVIEELEARKISRSELAKKCDISPADIEKIYASGDLSLDCLSKISELTKVNLADFFRPNDYVRKLAANSEATMLIRNRIQAELKVQGISQNELARRSGLSSASISQFSRGGDLMITTLGKLADGLGIAPSEMVRVDQVQAPGCMNGGRGAYGRKENRKEEQGSNGYVRSQRPAKNAGKRH